MVMQKVSLSLAILDIDIPAFYETSVYYFAGFTKRVRFYERFYRFYETKQKRFCLQLDTREYIGTENFGKINSSPIDKRFKYLFTSVFNSSLKCVLNI